MKRVNRDKKSMQSRVRQSTLIVLIVQVVLFGAIIIWGGTAKRLSEEYLKTLSSRVVSRKRYLEDTMLKQWSDLIEFENDVQGLVEEHYVTEDSILSGEFMEELAGKIVNTIRQHSVTGAFFILNSQENYQGIYMRDLDPTVNSLDNQDILLVRGPAQVGKSSNVLPDRQWEYYFDLQKEEEESKYFFKPLETAIKYPTLSTRDLGYWSKPFRLSENDIEFITYSIPLRNKQGDPYAVIGIEISLDYLRNSLYYNELAEDKQGGYLLGVEAEGPNQFHKVVASGPLLQRYIGSDTNIQFQDTKDVQDIYILDKPFQNKIYASVQYINLYNERTPFTNDRWALIGIVENKVLFAPINKLAQYIMLGLIFSLMMGLFTSHITGVWFVRPIEKLVQRVLNSDPSSTISLTKTDINEIDELAFAIESLSHKVADTSSKLSQIISMVNMPIGAFEYALDEKEVFCTESIFEILKIKNDKINADNITARQLREIIEEIIQGSETDLDNNIYPYHMEGEVERWLRIQVQEGNGKVLGVIEDVTQDVQTKHKIEYERDHDVLTQLLNRRAFSTRVRTKLRKEIHNAAFVMWDLDNLKYINDTYGHDYGDVYIKTAANILNEASIYNAIVARMSGDEFYTFIYGYKNKDDIRDKIQIIQEKLHNTLLTMPDGNIFRVRASGGVAWYPDDSKDYDELIKYSDFAMYEIKHNDKGSVGEFDRESYNKDWILLYKKEELNQFIDEELVKFEFQPIVDVKTGKVFAYEALMRPQLETLQSPVDIIRLARSQSKLHDIEKITLFNAMDAFVEHKDAFGDSKIFINSIPNYVLSEDNFQKFEKRYEKHLDRIVLEIIENEQSNEFSTKIKQDAVTRWGSHLALDDFGSGYNNEMVLLILSPKYIKIDMAIIRGIDTDRNRQKLMENIVSYANGRNIKIIAEGVETKGELTKLLDYKIDYLQGYYLGRPQRIPQQISKKVTNEILRK